MEIKDKVALKQVWEKPYQLGGRDTQANHREPGS
jgi:hypothetical protein